MPARNAMIQGLVPPEQRQNAVALNVVQMHTSRIIWPSLAGVMIGTLGIGATLTPIAVASLIGIVCLSSVHSTPVSVAPRGRSPTSEISEGIRYTFGHPLVGRLMTLMLCVATFGLFNSGILSTAQTMVHMSVPQKLLGRAMSLFGIVGGLGSISALPVGAAGDEFGLRYSLGFVGLILFTVTLLMTSGAQPLRWLGWPLDPLDGLAEAPGAGAVASDAPSGSAEAA